MLVIVFDVYRQQTAWDAGLAGRQNELQNLLLEIENGKREIAEMGKQRLEARNLQDKVVELLRKQQRRNSDVERLNSEVSERDAKLSGQIQEQIDRNDAIARLKEQRSSLDGEVKDREETRRGLLAEIETANSERTEAEFKRTEAQNRLQDAKSKLAAVEGNLGRRTDELGRRTAELQKIDGELNKKRGELSAVSGRISEHKAQLLELKSDIESWRQQTAAYREDLEGIEATVKTKRAAVSGLERQRIEAQETIANHEAVAAQLKVEFDREERLQEALKAENDSIMETLLKIRAALEQLKQDSREAEAELMAAKIQYQELLRRIETVRRTKTELEREHDRIQAKLGEARTDVGQLKEEANVVASELAAMRHNRKVLNGELDEAGTKSIALSMRISRAIEREVSLQAEIDSLNDQKRRLVSDNESKSELFDLLDMRTKNIGKEIALKRNEKTRLQVEINELSAKLPELRARRDILVKQIMTLQPELTLHEPNSEPEAIPEEAIEGSESGAE